MIDPPPLDPATWEDTEMDVAARNGIRRTVAFHYHVDGYRYTTLADALAQVARESRKRALQ